MIRIPSFNIPFFFNYNIIHFMTLENIISSNNRSFNVKVDQSSLATVLLYLDIFTLFLFIINTFTGRRKI